jgi:hypothetical protein
MAVMYGVYPMLGALALTKYSYVFYDECFVLRQLPALLLFWVNAVIFHPVYHV